MKEIYNEAQLWNLSEMGQNLDGEKMLKTKSAAQNMVERVQLKNFSEANTQQKKRGVVLNQKYSKSLTSLRDWLIICFHFRKSEKKLPENAQIIKNRSFSLISQRGAKKINPIFSSRKLIIKETENLK